MHDAGHTVAHRGTAGRLDADELDLGVLGEPGEDARRVGAAADARHHDVGLARAVGQRHRHCAAVSVPITRWNSRTIHGYGCGPMTEPRQ